MGVGVVLVVAVHGSEDLASMCAGLPLLAGFLFHFRAVERQYSHDPQGRQTIATQVVGPAGSAARARSHRGPLYPDGTFLSEAPGAEMCMAQ